MIINDRFKLESDGQQVILLKRNLKKDNTYSIYKNIGYFGSINKALEKMVKYEILDTELKDIETINNKIDELYELVSKLNIKEI